MALGPLTAELKAKNSPVRQFFDERFTSGLRDVQRRYRQAAPSLVVPSADRQDANPGTVGTAADWLLRFMLHPRPSLALAALGANLCGRRSGMPDALMELAVSLGYGHDLTGEDGIDFAGPTGGNEADPTYVASACWALALLTEVYRNPMVMMRGPLERFQYHRPSASQLLDLTPAAAFGQLAAFREVFETVLLPELACGPGHWALGPAFSGSALIKADADLITAGLLLDLKTDSRFSLGVTVLFQVIGYALLDFNDAAALISRESPTSPASQQLKPQLATAVLQSATADRVRTRTR
jgi:hypothetical protein